MRAKSLSLIRKTNIKWDYKLELALAGSSDSMEITFTDVNGEFFEGGNMQQDAIIGLIKEYDVFIVAVDTPFLMEARNEDNELVDPIINNKYNCIDSIHTFLTQIDDNKGENAKLVIFVPIKCEYWAKKGILDSVSDAIQEDYETSLKALAKYKSLQIEILPIQTVGSAILQNIWRPISLNGQKNNFCFSVRICVHGAAYYQMGKSD